MKALCWHGTGDVRIDTVPDPKIIESRDAIVKVTTTAICGSDLHLYGGLMPTMESGDVLGHEFMGEVMEVGPGRPASSSREIGWWCPLPFLAGPVSFARRVCSPCATRQIRMQRWRARPWDILPRACSVIPTCWAASPADRRNTYAFPLPTWVQSKFRPACGMSRCCSCPTSFPPDTWLRKTATWNGAIPLPCGAVDQSDNLPFKAHGCSAPAA